MTADPEVLFYNLAAGIGVGAVIVFTGVWVGTGWRLTRPLMRAVLLIILVTALGAALVSFLRVAPAGFVAGFAVAAVTFVLCSVLLALHRIRGALRRRRPQVWRRWALREVAETLVLPMAIFGFGVALVATGALFTTIQQGPHPDRLLFELSIVTATCWAMVMVGGVWARRWRAGR
ncbi:MAG: hypothetical protein MJE12_06180 [Alphaproteobacteria bacterium]|nr:hypothetical protein [Alphaproteobacteria bacterium]